MEEVYPDVIRIDVPLRGSPLKETHAYLIRGNPRNLLVDSGWNNPECEQALLGALQKLGVSLDDTDIFITHVHADHSGLSCVLKRPGNTVYMGKWDGDYSNAVVGVDYSVYLNSQSTLFGIPKSRIMQNHEYDLRRFMNNQFLDFKAMNEGDRISVGRFEFEVLDLCGHTPAQLGLWERRQGLLFCGDHILVGISPNIVIWPDDMDSIRLFADNLLKVRKLELQHVFSAHRSPVEDYRKRIDELIDHHENRLAEQIKGIGDEELTVFEIASRMHWDIAGGVFDLFPNQQTWFATSEAHAHAEHLYRRKLLQKRMEKGQYLYKRAPGIGKTCDCSLRA